MARLIMYVPFTPGTGAGDLRTNATELAAAPLAGFTIGGAAITAVVVVYLGAEATPGNQVVAGDVLCVHAHGGSGAYTSVTDNLGETTTLGVLEANLATLTAANAAAVYFFVCYSAAAGHVGARWKAAHPLQAAYGHDGVAEGGIIRSTRRAIYSSIFDADNRQLRAL